MGVSRPSQVVEFESSTVLGGTMGCSEDSLVEQSELSEHFESGMVEGEMVKK